MFSPDRQGFFPALWVQFVQELGEGERREFAALTDRLSKLSLQNDKYTKTYTKTKPKTMTKTKGERREFAALTERLSILFLHRYDDNNKGNDNDERIEFDMLTNVCL